MQGSVRGRKERFRNVEENRDGCFTCVRKRVLAPCKHVVGGGECLLCKEKMDDFEIVEGCMYCGDF